MVDSLGASPRADNRGGVARTSAVQTLDRAVALLEAVAEAGPVSLAALAERTGLTRPTVHRIAGALEAHGLLGRDGEGRFHLGGRIVGWGARAGDTVGLARRAQPVLDALLARTGESAQLYVREGIRRVCIASAERTSGLRDTVPLGASLPLTAGSGGTVLLAWAPDLDRVAGVDAARVAEARAHGFAASVEEREPGVASVSAPVHDANGAVVAAISVSGPADRVGPGAGHRFGPAVLDAASALETGPGTRRAESGAPSMSPPRNRPETERP